MGVCIYRRGRESTAVAIPSRLICMGQPLVPEEPAMTSSWTSSPSSSAFRSSRRAIQRAHTATHLLHKALQTVLGDHVHQAGSLVEPDRLRFDFTHFSALTAEELAKVSALVNEAVLEGYDVVTEELPIEEAKKKGAIALFGEKYGDTVRVVLR